MLKLNFKKFKNIVLIFSFKKNTLKNKYYYTSKYFLNLINQSNNLIYYFLLICYLI